MHLEQLSTKRESAAHGHLSVRMFSVDVVGYPVYVKQHEGPRKEKRGQTTG